MESMASFPICFSSLAFETDFFCVVATAVEKVMHVTSRFSRMGDLFHLVLRPRVSSTSTKMNPTSLAEFDCFFVFFTSSGVNRLKSADQGAGGWKTSFLLSSALMRPAA